MFIYCVIPVSLRLLSELENLPIFYNVFVSHYVSCVAASMNMCDELIEAQLTSSIHDS